ncbi:MAG TPA: hypothetical protein ENK11_06305 [Phycisphaerales bacterium]|nr:hypothetical protein [Phycisphaerales bacterium]
MGIAVNNVAASVAGTQQQGRVTKRDVEHKAPARQKRGYRDEFNQLVETSEADHIDAVRSLKDNSQEEAHEDRQEHEQPMTPERGKHPVIYSPRPTPQPPTPRHQPATRLDLEG